MSILDIQKQNTPQLPPEKFLCYFPQSFIQYLDDSSAKDISKALSIERLDPHMADRKQKEGCGVYFSPNPFEGGRKIQNLVYIQAVYLDIDYAKEGDGQDCETVKRKKEEGLLKLMTCKLPPHIITDTKNGIQAVWRVWPVGGEKGLRMFRDTEDILLAFRG